MSPKIYKMYEEVKKLQGSKKGIEYLVKINNRIPNVRFLLVANGSHICEGGDF
jgi:hypothetical protein